MDYVKIRTVAADHPRFLEAGELASALWAWGMLYAGRHETDGKIPRVAVLAWPWCASRARAMKAAYKLVLVGLWTNDGPSGFEIVGWSEQGNVTKADLVTRRREEREKKARQRSRRDLIQPADVPGGHVGGLPRESLTLNSSSSGSSSSGGDARGGTVALDEDLRAWAVTVGASPPTAAHLEAYELWLAENGRTVADRRSGFKRWLLNEKRFARGPAVTKQPMGSAALQPWADPDRNDGFGDVGT